MVFTDCESCTRPISTSAVSMEAGEYGLTRGMFFFRTPSRGDCGRPAAVDIVVCLGGADFFLFFN